MWVVLLLVVVNVFMSIVANYIIRFSALDIIAVSMIIIGMRGQESIYVAAILLFLAYAVPAPKEFRFFWIVLPMAVIIAKLAGVIPSIFLLLIIWHSVGAISALVFGYFNAKYAMFIIVNFSLNLVMGKLYRLILL